MSGYSKLAIDRRTLISNACAAGVAASLAMPGEAFAGERPASNLTFKPGAPWLDTTGKQIHLRGSSIIQVGRTFYWYGENKERTTGKDRIWHWGMRMYSSTDLYNWTDLGTFIPPTPDNPSSPLHPFQFADRPHILFNRRTGKYVCWIKFLGEQAQTRSVLVADAVTGPYSIVSSGVMPLGMVSTSTPRLGSTFGFRSAGTAIALGSNGAIPGRSTSSRTLDERDRSGRCGLEGHLMQTRAERSFVSATGQGPA